MFVLAVQVWNLKYQGTIVYVCVSVQRTKVSRIHMVEEFYRLYGIENSEIWENEDL